MNRVLVIGSCGAGKSTFSYRLKEKINIPIIHLDQEYWNSGWVETPKAEWTKKLNQLIHRPQFIMDGNYLSSLPLRLSTADTVIYLDYPTAICFWRVLKRITLNYGKRRPDSAAGCYERFDLEFLHYVLVFNLTRRKKIIQLLDNTPDHIHIVTLKNDRQVDTYLDSLYVDKNLRSRIAYGAP